MKKNHNPPDWIDKVLDRLAPSDLIEEIKGDLYEFFCKDIAEKGIRSAKRNYVFNSLGFLTKSFFWKQSSTNTNPINMLSSYFKMARRSLVAYKGNTIINVLGLVTGIASALVILYVIRYEKSFDAFHTNADQIYRLVRVSGPDLTISERSECRTGVSFPVPDAIKQGASSIQKITSITYLGGALIEVPDKSGAITKRFNEENGCALVEPSFFSIFDFKGTNFKWISGNSNTALEQPFTIVLTRSMSEKYFPEGNAFGRTLKIDKRFDCTVTGIIEDLPDNTDFPISILVSYASLRANLGNRMNDWISVDDNHQTYIVPVKGATIQKLEKQIAAVHAANTPKDIHESRHYLLQPLKEVHFDPRFGNFNRRTITHQTIVALGIIALFLLLTGSINYINLATAQSVTRSKEIGLRKVMGGNRKSLATQFLMETLLVVSMAGILALGLSEILLINLQSLLNIKLHSYNFADPLTIVSVLAIIIVVTIFSGVYPSLVISRFSPIESLKNKFSTETLGGFSLRKVLVVAQFTITQILVVGTFVVVAQMNFFQNADMGFNHEAVITVSVPERNEAKRETMATQLRSQAFVSAVSFSYTLPSGVHRNGQYSDIGKMDGSTSKDFAVYEFQSIDTSYLNLYKISLLAGRSFQPPDSSPTILINKTLAKNLQLGTPEEAVGSELKKDGKKHRVIGVFDDFYSNSLKESVDNMVMEMNPSFYRVASIKLTPQAGEALPDAIKQIEKIWTTTYPEYIFTYEFLDENIKAYYAQEQKYADLFQLFCFLFLLIGCLGLYGLITFVVNRKGKEIAIRKVLGATLSGLLMMFSKEYIKLIGLSFLFAAPVAYYAVNSWLGNFAHHIELHWWLFATPGVFVLLIAIFVVCTKALGEARRNPTDNLKCE